MKNGYLLLLFFALLFVAIVGSNLQREYVPVNITDNTTVVAPLMSVPDNGPANTEEKVEEEPGWWLHKGHSYVSSVIMEHAENMSETADVDLVILLNGQDAGSFPGPQLASGSQVTIEYCVTNTGNVGLDDVIVTDTVFGNIGEYESLAAGEGISFVSSGTVREGQFFSTGKVVAFNESRSQTCGDEHGLHYLGMKTTEVPVSDIPEFPTMLLPVTMIMGLVFIFGRRAR